MTILRDDEQAQDRIEQALLLHYGRMLEDGYVDDLLKRLGGIDPGVVEQALDEHIGDTSPGHGNQPIGHHPPSAARLLALVERLQPKQSTDKDYHHAQPSGEKRLVEIPENMRQYFPIRDAKRLPTGQYKTHIEVYSSYCRDCSDTGIARFFHSRDRRRVWTTEEFWELPEAMKDQLNSASAVCDCSRGRNAPERGRSVEVWHEGRQRRVSTFPRMEHIREMAKQRIDEDLEVVGNADAF